MGTASLLKRVTISLVSFLAAGVREKKKKKKKGGMENMSREDMR